MKEAAARIKINKLLDVACWGFFGNVKSPANIQLEPSVTLKARDLDALGATRFSVNVFEAGDEEI